MIFSLAILLGARVSMRVGATVVLLSGIAGVLIGGFAGYVGGKLDTFVTVVVINSLMAFPGILLAIALVAFLGPGLDRLIFALSCNWLGRIRAAWREDRFSRSRLLSSSRPSARLGASSLRIFFSHILPNIIQPSSGSSQHRNGRCDSRRSVIEFSGSGD